MAEVHLPALGMADAFNEIDFKFYKLLKCVTTLGQKVMMRVVKEVFKSQPTSKQGTVTIKEYLKSMPGWTTNKIEELVTKQSLFILKADFMQVDFDITLAYKLLRKVFPEVYIKFDDNCREAIVNLKSMRNSLSHVLSPKEIHVLEGSTGKLDKLKEIYRNIYLGVGACLGTDFSAEIKSVEQDLSEIHNAKFNVVDLSAYTKLLQNFNESLIHQLIREGQLELIQRYKGLRLVNPCTWMLSKDKVNSVASSFYIEKIYTPLKIEDAGRGGCQDVKIDAQKLLIIKKKIHGNMEVPPALVMYGLAGCGKTSLCRYLLHTWANHTEDVAGMKDLDLVILVEVRALRGKNLRECLKEQLLASTYSKIINNLKTCNKMTDNLEDDLIRTLREIHVLFIIDGVDEANDDVKSILKDLIAKFGSYHRIILTTRPEFLRDVSNWLECCHVDNLLIKIYGFDEKRIQEFTAKVFDVALECKSETQRKREWKNFTDYIEERGKILDEHLKLPLTLALLIILWIDVVDDAQRKTVLSKVTNCTSLYFQLFKNCQRRLIHRLDKNIDIKVLDRLLVFLGKIAWQLLQSNNMVINENMKMMIEKECEDSEVSKEEMMSAFLMCDYDENVDYKFQYFTFLHKTQMEYLAAQFLAEQLQRDRLKDVIVKVTEWIGLQQVIMFLIGHLSLSPANLKDDDLDIIFKLVNLAEMEQGSFDYWWKFLVEANKEQKVGKIIVHDWLPLDRWILQHPEQIVSGLELLIATPVPIKCLTIEVSNKMDPYDIKNFLEIMQLMKTKLKYRYRNKKPLLVELNFWYHNENRCKRPSDDLVHTLYPWGHLTHLTGWLGTQEKGKELLNFCFKMKCIRVRLCSLEAVTCLSVSIGNIYKSIKELRVTLDMTPAMVPDPTMLPSLSSNGNLEVTLLWSCDEYKEWVVQVVKSVSHQMNKSRGRGCTHLTLEKSELTGEAVKYLMKNLKNVVTEKMSVATLCNITDEDMYEVERLQTSTYILINWI